MYSRYAVDTFLARLSSMERFDKLDSEDVLSAIEEGRSTRYDEEEAKDLESLLSLISCVRGFVKGLEVSE